MSDKQRTETGSTGDDDAGGPTGDAGDGPTGRAAAPSDDKGDTGTYPAEKLDLGGGTSDGDTPSTDDGG
jgi:hypothetical protein